MPPHYSCAEAITNNLPEAEVMVEGGISRPLSKTAGEQSGHQQDQGKSDKHFAKIPYRNHGKALAGEVCHSRDGSYSQYVMHKQELMHDTSLVFSKQKQNVHRGIKCPLMRKPN